MNKNDLCDNQYHTIIHRTILYHSSQHTILIILQHTIPYNTILYHTISHDTIPYHGIHSQKRHRLDTSCGFYWPGASLAPTSCIKPVDVAKLHQVCEHQTCCNLIFADLPQADEMTYMQFATCSKSVVTICNRLVIIKPKQAIRTHPDIGLVIADYTTPYYATPHRFFFLLTRGCDQNYRSS